MRVDKIRDRFLRFFKERRHTIHPSDSLVPSNDPTLLFTGAGMNQFKDEFLGRVKGSRRAATCQKCIRTGDLENVGKTAGHHTFFEMLGNFSFGDYFKKEAIEWAWEFLTKDLGLKEKDLWVSVYKDDKEAYDIWKNAIKVPEEKILKLGPKDNFWPANAPEDGPNGPCGPCSEIFYGGEDGVEIWNLVFTQFDRKDDGKLDPLLNKNIDTGMGLERIARVMQGKKNNFEIDSFAPIVNIIKDLSIEASKKAPKENLTPHINAIADHIRASTFAISDGVLPSNEGRGYVIRKLIRRAFWYGRGLGLEEPFLYRTVPVIANVMEKPYPEIKKHREDISQVVQAEEDRFKATLEEGLDNLEDIIKRAKSSKKFSGRDAFKLYDTYGFPLELTKEIILERGMKLDEKEFEACMEEQREKSRESSKIKEAIFDSINVTDKIKIAVSKFHKDNHELESKIVAIISKDKEVKELKKGEKGSLFFEETPFYGEKGGQVGDSGTILKANKTVAEVKLALDIVGRTKHEILVKEGDLKLGEKVVLKVDLERREKIKKNHTATHLLHHALRKVLGEHVKQAGSLVAPDRLRFDFTHFKALSNEELVRIEELVNENIKKKSPVETNVMAIDKAKKEGAIALFGEKYSDEVRMVNVGGYSKELCGGTHVKDTREIKCFKILSESSIASGVRRIEAVTSDEALEKIKEKNAIIEEIASILDVKPEYIEETIEKYSDGMKKIEKELETVSQRLVQVNIDDILKHKKDISGHAVIISEIKNADMNLLRKTGDVIKSRVKDPVFILVSEKDEKISLIVGLSSKDIKAGDILNKIGSDFGIRGGGRPDLAQAGGKSGPDINKILKKAEEVIHENLKTIK
ncbi:MAG: alanine--tRNA ligase [Candidatus Omnitrophota bacterium]